MELLIVRKTMEADGIASFELTRPDGGPLSPFSPGAHIDVYVPGGLVRQYSLCSPANETHRYRIAVLRDLQSRGGSEFMHASLQEGDAIHISEPRNLFPLQRGVPHTLLLGGGIGITPMICMADQLARDGASFELHYCVRSLSRTAFHDELRHGKFAKNVHFHFDDEPMDQRFDIGQKLMSCSSETHIYVCGPLGFMNAVIDKAHELQWEDSRIHFEYFAASVSSTDGNNNDERKMRPYCGCGMRGD